MINATSEFHFLYRGFRALIGFRMRTAFAWIRYGHFVRAKAIRNYLVAHSNAKLQLGGSYPLEDFLNSQITGVVPIDITTRLPLPDTSFTLIYSSHLVEHVHRLQFTDFLVESLRILKPGGIHIIATPSIEKIARTIYGPDSPDKDMLMGSGARFYPEPFHTEAHQLNLTMRAFGHRFLYDLAFMREAGLAAGFVSIEKIDSLDPPDPVLAKYVRKRKPTRWNAETETFVFHAPQ